MLDAEFANQTVLLIITLFFGLLLPFGIVSVSITFFRRIVGI